MDATEKAKTITKYRNLARAALARYRHSQDIADIKEVVEHERLTTEIAPDTCPTCYREYGLALSMAGRHHYYLQEDALVSAEEAERQESSEQATQLYEEASKERQEMVSNFQRSARAYNSYFIHPGNVYINPQDFWRVMTDQEFMEDYDQALRYLDLYVSYRGKNIGEQEKELADDKRREYRRKAQAERGLPEASANGNSPEGTSRRSSRAPERTVPGVDERR